MIWIKKVNIENFESHKNTSIDFSPGFNILTGSSNSGKSSILRAIIWVCFNEPSGQKFIRKDSDSLRVENSDKKKKHGNIASVEIELSNGYKVKRQRSGSPTGGINRYILIDADENETEYNQFGYDVPDAIKEILGFSSVNFGNKKNIVNYLSQFEPPRALTYQGNALSSLISKLNNLEAFEEALITINSRIHQRGEIPTKERIYNDEFKRLTEEIENFPDVSDKINIIENILIPKIEHTDILKHKIEIAKNILIEAENLKNKYSILNAEIKKLNEIMSVESKLQYIDNILSRMDLLTKILNQVDKINKSITSIDRDVKNNNINHKINTDKYENIINILEKYNHFKNFNLKINEEEKDINSKIIELEKLKNNNINNMKIYIMRYFNQNNQCPLCDSEIENQEYDHIVKHLSEE